MEFDYNWLYCENCNVTYVVECRLDGDGDRLKDVVCPTCGACLGQVSADDGYDVIGMACGYFHPGKACFGADP